MLVLVLFVIVALCCCQVSQEESDFAGVSVAGDSVADFPLSVDDQASTSMSAFT